MYVYNLQEKKPENFVLKFSLIKKIWNSSGDKGICCTLFPGCITTSWGEWTECTKTCDGPGQQFRNRNYVNPDDSAVNCNETLVEERPCGEEPCISKYKLIICSYCNFSSTLKSESSEAKLFSGVSSSFTVA